MASNLVLQVRHTAPMRLRLAARITLAQRPQRSARFLVMAPLQHGTTQERMAIPMIQAQATQSPVSGAKQVLSWRINHHQLGIKTEEGRFLHLVLEKTIVQVQESETGEYPR